MGLARMLMIQTCVIEILLFSKIDLVFLKISSSLACAKRKHHDQDEKYWKKMFEPQTY